MGVAPVWKLLTGGDSILEHALPAGIGDAHPGDGVEPVTVMSDVHVIPGIWTPVKGYSTTVATLEGLGYRQPTADRAGNLLPVAYDWRLSNRYNGQRLATVVEPALERWRAQGGEFADARVVFVCHSMGGLVARWYIEKCGGAGITRKLITLGTPWRGSLNALEQLANGTRKGFGPLSIDLTGFARSLPSLHQLLPEYACVSSGDGYLKTTETTLPELDAAMVSDAMAFHTDLMAAEAARPESHGSTHQVVGVRQPAATTATVTDGTVVTHERFDGDDEFGDSTVPLTGAIGLGEQLDTNLVVRVPEQHTNLQCNPFVLDQVQAILAARPVRRRDPLAIDLRARVPDLRFVGEALEVEVVAESNGAPDALAGVDLVAPVSSEQGAVLASAPITTGPDGGRASFTDLPPGTHTVTISGAGGASLVRPVTSTTLVWPRVS